MKKFLNQTLEVKALTIAILATLVGFFGTMFLFWFSRYDVPLGILLGGTVIAITWLVLYLSKRDGKNHPKLDVVIIYLRLMVIVVLALLFTLLELYAQIVTISPISLVVSYLVVSLLTLLAYIKKGDGNV